MSTDSAATVRKVTRHAGIAGQVSYSAVVGYPGEDDSTVTFVGSVYGGPVVMVTPSGTQVFVTDPDRFGTFGSQWVRRFFASGGAEA
jgi:hypothetical protein